MFIKYLLILLILSLTFGQIDRFSIGYGIALRFSDLITGIIFIIWTIKLFKKGKFKLMIKNPVFKPTVVFITVSLFSLLINRLNLDINQLLISSLYLIRWILYASIFFIITSEPEDTIKSIKKSIIITSLILVILGFIQYFYYPNLRNIFYLGWDDHLYRLTSTFLDPNFAAVHFNLFFMLLLGQYLIDDKLSLKYKRLTLVGLIFTLIALLLTYSRSGFLMFIVGNSILLWLTNKKKFIGLVFLILLLGIFLIPRNLQSSGVQLWRTASILARTESASNALSIFNDHPLFGIGFNTFRYANLKYGFINKDSWDTNHAGAGTDNSFLFVLVTTGVFGLVAYLNLWKTIISFTIFSNNNRLKKDKVISVVLISSIIGLFINSIFINSLFYPSVMLWIWILLSLVNKESNKAK